MRWRKQDDLDLSDMSRLGTTDEALRARPVDPVEGRAASLDDEPGAPPTAAAPSGVPPAPPGQLRTPSRPPSRPPRSGRSGGGPSGWWLITVVGGLTAFRLVTGPISDALDRTPEIPDLDLDLGDVGVDLDGGATTTTVPARLFEGDLEGAYTDLLAAAGTPAEIIELSVYEDRAILAYRDPVDPEHIDRRTWDADGADPATPNPIHDRVTSDTAPRLFSPSEIDPGAVTAAIADAPGRYDVPVEVTHVIVERFLPFDERVLIRVYVSPLDGRSGGGYASYDTAGSHVETCC